MDPFFLANYHSSDKKFIQLAVQIFISHLIRLVPIDKYNLGTGYHSI
jgi:hypothetical protein